MKISTRNESSGRLPTRTRFRLVLSVAGLLCVAAGVAASPAPASAADLTVSSAAPAAFSLAPNSAVVEVTFDRAADTATVTSGSFSVRGRAAGPLAGTISFSNADTTATFAPAAPLLAGDQITVALGSSITAAIDGGALTGGWQATFRVASRGVLSNEFRELTRLLLPQGPVGVRGSSITAADWNGDGSPDLAVATEIASDIRVFLNKADDSGNFHPLLTPATAVAPSPTRILSGDFDRDGNLDVAVVASANGDVSVALGNGDGAFTAAQTIDVGEEARGIATVDADADGDLDLIVTEHDEHSVSILLNDGAGTFATPSTIASVPNPWGICAADLNDDGLPDLAIGDLLNGTVHVLLGNGDGTYAAGGSFSSGQGAWAIAAGDLDGDGDADLVTANDGAGTIAVLSGNGSGSFGAPTLYTGLNHVKDVRLGDFDGDGDLDVTIPSFGGGVWRLFSNDGSGTLTETITFPASSTPASALFLDFDGDTDLDMALLDEIFDEVSLQENTGGDPPASCPAVPSPTCLQPVKASKSQVKISDKDGTARDQVSWKWFFGAATTKQELGNPLGHDSYVGCFYDAGGLFSEMHVAAGGICGDKACWKERNSGFQYKNKARTPDGIEQMKLQAGTDGRAKIFFRGKGDNLPMPADLTLLASPVAVQLHGLTTTECWGANFSAPFSKQSAERFDAKSDAP